jgi:hypothetical protein
LSLLLQSNRLVLFLLIVLVIFVFGEIEVQAVDTESNPHAHDLGDIDPVVDHTIRKANFGAETAKKHEGAIEGGPAGGAEGGAIVVVVSREEIFIQGANAGKMEEGTVAVAVPVVEGCGGGGIAVAVGLSVGEVEAGE